MVLFFIKSHIDIYTDREYYDIYHKNSFMKLQLFYYPYFLLYTIKYILKPSASM